MSKRDFDEYYRQLCDQYIQLNEELKEFQRIATEKAIEPERLENMKKTFQPILDTYQMISWVAFLLNKPVKKTKHKNYSDMLAKKTSKLNRKFNKETILNSNDQILKDLNHTIHTL